MALHYSPELCQELATAHLVANQRAALWMGMGLGKTAATLSAYLELRNAGKVRGMLVVAPLRVCVLTWPNEIRKWLEFNQLQVSHVMTESGWRAMEAGASDIYIINWENLVFLSTYFLHGKRAHQLPFDLVVFDELTKAKNPDSIRVNQFRAYVNKFPWRWGLTGTPAPNSLLDVYAQIRLLDDGASLGKSYAAFRDAHFQSVDRYNYTWIPRANGPDRIYRRLADIALVLRSSDYLDIPNTIVEDVEVELPKRCEQIYEELSDELLAVTDSGEAVTAVNAGVLVGKLLQVTGGAVYKEQRYSDDGRELPLEVLLLHSEKIKVLLSLLKRLNEPVIVVCQYRHEQDRVAQAVPAATRLDSARTETAIQQLEQRWNAKQIPCLIVHPQSVGHGLNFQAGGRIVVWYSMTYSRELYDQTNARVARSGQTSVTLVYRLLCKGSIDEAVVSVLSDREKSQSALLQAVEYYRKIKALLKHQIQLSPQV